MLFKAKQAKQQYRANYDYMPLSHSQNEDGGGVVWKKEKNRGVPLASTLPLIFTFSKSFLIRVSRSLPVWFCFPAAQKKF